MLTGRKEKDMLVVGADHGNVNIISMIGTNKSIVQDLGAIAHKTLLTLANNNTSKEEVCFRYGLLARELVDYMEYTVHRVDEIGGEELDKH